MQPPHCADMYKGFLFGCKLFPKKRRAKLPVFSLLTFQGIYVYYSLFSHSCDRCGSQRQGGQEKEILNWELRSSTRFVVC